MTDAFLNWFPLLPHPASPPDTISAVLCGTSWRDRGAWVVDFIVREPPAALRLPEPAAPERADGLWRTTCFELFLRRPDEKAYIEFNFSPSGRWAAYAFDDYRKGGRNLEVAAPIIRTADPVQFASATQAHLSALGLDPDVAQTLADAGAAMLRASPVQFAVSVTLSDPAFAEPGPWLANLTAVIEEAHGTMSYWALAHGSDVPDFHHPDGFVLELP
jgi:hypothetical protein